MARARSFPILAALIALAAGTAAETGGFDMPSASLPALAASPLVYALVPNPLGAKTWAERQVEEVRLGFGLRMREEASAVTSFILMSIHAPRTASAYALEMMEAPRDEEPRLAAGPVLGREMDAFAEGRIVGALEAMGLRPEDLVDASETSPSALALADAVSRLFAMVFSERRLEYEPGSAAASLRVDPEDRYVREPGNPQYRKPPVTDPTANAPLMIFAKRVVRSIYKILLGVAIGVLIWGFVRNT